MDAFLRVKGVSRPTSGGDYGAHLAMLHANRLRLWLVVLSLPVLLCGSAARSDFVPPELPDLGYEITLTTDKTVYSLGEEVHAVHRIYNPYEGPVTIQLLCTPGFDLWAMRDDVKVWGYWRMFHAFGGPYDLPPGWTVFEYAWDMTDTWGEVLVSPGEYEMVGVIHSDSYPPSNWISTPITIVPEPGTGLMLLAFAFVGLIRKRQR